MKKVQLTTRVRQILEDASGIAMENIAPDVSFIEAGLDSLLLTQVAITLKKEFGLPITFRQINEEYSSISSLTDFLAANLPEEQVTQTFTATATGGTGQLGAIAAQLQLLAQQVAQLQGGSTDVPANLPPPRIHNVSGSAVVTREEAIELKKPFGASARIDRSALGLSDKQQAFLTGLTARYTTKTGGSKAYTQRHREQMSDPRVVSGFRPLTKEIVYPIVVNKSAGSRVWDIDGNEYIDALNGFGSNLLGHKHPAIAAALIAQIEQGYEIGPQHELAGPVCELICSFTGAERAALCNTGSEAVLGAMRIARTVTGRNKIVAFSGSYHGINDEVIVRGTKSLKTFPGAAGILPDALQNMLILEYGTDETLDIIRKNAHELAAVLVEPVQSRRPEFQPVAFLKELRNITAAAGTVLVFDEVITGFRMHPGGAQALFGIKADIGTYGKVVAGGLPIGVIAGKKEYMDALDGGYWQYGDDSAPEAGVTYFAGTFVRHPLALASTLASLQLMQKEGPGLQEQLTKLTHGMAERLNIICLQYALPIFVAHFGSLWKFKFKVEMPYGELLFTLMREKGIHIWDLFPCFLTTAHTAADVDFIIAKFEESVVELKDAGFFAKTLKSEKEHNEMLEAPPVPGARLGRDQAGNPAWFLADPARPGKYLQLT